MIVRALVAALLLAGLSLLPDTTAADVPGAADIAACNEEARTRAGTASPNAKDRAGAEAVRREQPEVRDTATPATREPMASPDPQLDGMDPGGARDAAYRSAYRVCMRRNGF